MVDFVTVILKDLPASDLEANPLLDFSMWQNLTEHGEYIPVRDIYGNAKKTNSGTCIYKTPYKSAFFRGLEFVIYETGLVKMSGSLHMYHNAGIHNYDDFHYINFCCVLSDLQKKFGLTTSNCVLKCLEIGVNIVPPIPTNEILSHCFLHKTTLFEDCKNSQEGRYKQAQHSQYIIKIYNKALHYISQGFEIVAEIMRFEVKYTKMEKVNKLGIFTLRDLEEFGLEVFKIELLREFNNILFFDKTAKFYNGDSTKYNNPVFWAEVLRNKSRSTFYKHKEALRRATVETSEKIQDQTSQLINQKISELVAGERIDH